MAGALTILLLFPQLLLFPDFSSSFPLCTNSRKPVTPKTPLAFCPYNGSICCDSVEDILLQKKFEAMNVSDSSCASLLKLILCATCDQFSAKLFNIESGPRTVPVLCNTTISVNASHSHSAVLNAFCGKVWDTCQNVSILNSPFSLSFHSSSRIPLNSTSSKLTDLWKSRTEFCNEFGGASGDGSICFDGIPVSINNNAEADPHPPNGMCLEKIGNGSYLDMVAHPDGSNRIFLSNQQGKIWLATVPEVGSGGTLGMDELNPFLDLTDEVHFESEFGMWSVAFHPNFVGNGRFFVSFTCDEIQWSGCYGRCACNSDVNCDPSKLDSDKGARPCRYHSVISEFTANGTASQLSLATRANPIEVRRIFTMGLPYASSHGGQILFGPADGYFYVMMGDSGNGDPSNFAQKKKSLLGKIMRLDIDSIPGATEIDELGLWGNYSIPRDNPYSEDEELQPEIWALGFRNPWRCSFDSKRPSYFICADTGQEEYEEVDIVTKGGNFGWRVYEGSTLYNPPMSPGGNTSANSIKPIFPVMGYSHSAVSNKTEGSASIIGGYFYRSMSDLCMHGRYLYSDLYANIIWAGTESPENSGNFTSDQISFTCAHDSPIQCSFVAGSPLPSLGYVFSFGEDNMKDVFILASSGVYRVVRPSRCNYTCSKEDITTDPSRTSSSRSRLRVSLDDLVILFFLSLLPLLGFVL